MASRILIGVCVILMETNTISAACTEQFVNVGVTNQRLVFKFEWINTETKAVNCFYGTNNIGDCVDVLGITCSLDSKYTGSYTMYSNADLTEVYVSIGTFNYATAGNYSCSKYTGTTVAVCVKDSATTTPPPPTDGECSKDWTDVCTHALIIFLMGCIIFIVLILITVKKKLYEHCQGKCLIVFEVLCFISSTGASIGLLSHTHSNKGRNDVNNTLGLVFGWLGVSLALLPLLLWFCIYIGSMVVSKYEEVKLQQLHKDPSTQGGTATSGASITTTTTASSFTVPKPKTVMELQRIDLKLLKLGVEIGQSEFGSVMKAVYSTKDGEIAVVVKLSHKTFINIQEDFLKEEGTMLQLSHECIVKFLGISESMNNKLLLVEEYMQESMLYWLRNDSNNVSSQDLIIWAAQIAYGMMYLEKQNIVHRDLAAKNILLHNKNLAKISVIGLSRAVGRDTDLYKPTAMGGWPIKWYAPECWTKGKFSHASDVWSFGVTLWEMFSYGLQPYKNMNGEEVTQFIKIGKRLEQPHDCPNVLYEEMRRCWNMQETHRPDFKELKNHIEKERIQ